MGAQAEATRCPAPRVEADQPAHRRVQPVGGQHEAGRLPVDEDACVVLLEGPDGPRLDRHPGRVDGVPQRRVQGGAADPAARAVPEVRLGDPRAVGVADPGQPVTGRVHPHVGQQRDRARHQSLPAGLVDHAAARLAHDDVEAGPGGVQCRGQAHRAAPGDDQVAHQAGSAVRVRSAAFSTPMRTVSSAAFSTVKTSAVIQAACTIGSAIPSTTTAT